MEGHTFSIAFLLGLTGMSAMMDPPVARWPLNMRTFGYEVKNGVDAIRPTLHQCFPVNPVGNMDLTESSSLIFDGSTNSYVDVYMDGSINFDSSVMITVYAKPMQHKARSVVFHYKSTLNDITKITEMILEGNNGDYNATLIYGDGTFTTTVGNSDFMLNTLHIVAMRYKYDAHMMSVSIPDLPGHIVNAKQIKLGLPGVLRFGGHQMISGVGFIGELSCAAIYSTNNNIGLASEIRGYCNQAYTDPSVVPTCFEVALTPYMVWPLDDMGYGFEVRHNMSPIVSTDFRFLDGPSYLPNKAIRMDGSYLSAIITTVPSNVLQDEFSFMMYIYLNDASDGQIFHIKSSLPYNGINKLTVKLTDCVVTVLVYDQMSSGICGHITIANKTMFQQWQTLSVQRKSNTIHLKINEEWFTSNDTCITNANPVTTNFTLVIGAANSTEEGFKGAIRCLVLNRLLHVQIHVNDALDTVCSSHEVTMFSITVLPPTFREQAIRYKLRKVDATPPLYIIPVISYSNISLTSCGKRCIDRYYCRSYSYDSPQRICTIYDILIMHRLDVSIGTNYYSIEHIIR